VPTDIQADQLAQSKEGANEEVKEWLQDRRAFVRKVLGIVTTQFALSMYICFCASYYENFGYYCSQWWMALILILVMIPAIIGTFVMRRKVPINYGMLFLFTVCEALLFGSMTAQLTPESVLTAIGVMCATLACLLGGSLIAPSPQKLLIMLIVALAVGVVT